MSFCKLNLSKNKYNLFFALGLLLVVVSIFAYKNSIISSYVVNVADEDQAIMWYGTMAALDNNIREPHFIGQKYGSMIEAYVAIPFYLLGVPIEYAVPLATLVLWLLPFVMCSFALAKNEQWLEAIIILGMSVIYGWQYDLLTSISRSFIGGFWLTFLGILLLLKEEKEVKDILGIIAFFTLGFWVSEQTITIVALCVCHVLFKENFFIDPKGCLKRFQEWDREKQFALFFGLFLAIIFLGYCNYYFYRLHPDYNHHKIGSFRPAARILITNLRNIGELLSAYSLVTFRGIPVFLLTVVGLFLWFWQKSALKECLMLFGLSILGILLIMCSKKSIDFIDTLLLDKRRLYLFVPYIGLFLAYLSFKLTNLSDLILEKFGGKALGYIFGVLVFAFVGIAGIKTYDFQNNHLFDEQIHTSYILKVRPVSAIKEVAKEIKQVVKENSVKNVIFIEDCTYAYGTAAFNYGEYRTYLSHYERKTRDYLYYKNNPYTGKILFVNCGVNGLLSYKIEEFQNCNIIDYITHRYLRDRNRFFGDVLYEKECL